MSYFRRPMGDGPVTSPSQVDEETTVAEVTPTRVDCDQLAADSPWRRPGQVCAPTKFHVLDMLSDLVAKAREGMQTVSATQTSPPAAARAIAPWMMLATAGGLAYLLLKNKKRRA